MRRDGGGGGRTGYQTIDELKEGSCECTENCLLSIGDARLKSHYEEFRKISTGLKATKAEIGSC